jgi:LDH2 family malate/lactate/ureidoglycolate dehydrogenase
VEQHIEQLAALDTLDAGKLFDVPSTVRAAAALLRQLQPQGARRDAEDVLLQGRARVRRRRQAHRAGAAIASHIYGRA